ncbi:hypothetical protein Mettu_2450 [Methylobacter tundripaludum SV96]|uniref:HNH endonuclease n=2 Tax=Methylobacter tundripaludum TaxID=173365 RepID=G3IR18_METTV|nr:hypothetical protein Mettu_2450 [Methylobacter tundripaludum SV96]
MISITTQKDAGKIRDLSFCYICGIDFQESDSKNLDHVPPKSIFAKPDRDFPLKFTTHKDQCHSPMNLDDEVISQLFALIHGKQPSEKNDKLKIGVYQRTETGAIMASFSERNIEILLRRWLKGFHAALYREPLDENTRFAIQTPFPSGVKKDDQFIDAPIKEQHYEFVECIKKNRAIGKLDCIQSNNGRLRYECVWDKLSNGSWSCIFALNLYDWKNLGDINNFKARGCAGMYSPPNGKAPNNAALATQLEFRFENLDEADPFGL